MLQYFAVSRDYNKLRVRLFVDLEHKDAEISVLYAGRIKSSHTVPFAQVDDIEKAEAVLRQEGGVHGTFFQALERKYSAEAA